MPQSDSLRTGASTTLSAATADCGSRHVRPDAAVLEGLPLRTGEAATTCYADDCWDLSPGYLHSTRKNLPVPFGRCVDAATRTALKDLLYWRMRAHLSARLPAWVPHTAWMKGNAYLALDVTFQARYGQSLLAVTQEQLDAWVRAELADGRHPEYLGSQITLLRNLYDFREHLTFSLPFRPFGRRPPSHVTGRHRPAENRTPRIPEPIMGALLAWALRYVDVYAVDIVAAINEESLMAGGVVSVGEIAASQRERRAGVTGRRPTPRAEHARQLVSWLRKSGRGFWVRRPSEHAIPSPFAVLLPTGVAGREINLGVLGRAMGLGRNSRALAADDNAVKELREGLEELGMELDRLVRVRPQALPVLLGEDLVAQTLSREIAHLATACYIVVAFLSGMRDSEVHSLRTDCRQVERDGEDRIVRYKLRGRVYKARAPGGEPATWVVIEPVHRAIEGMLALRAALRMPGEGPLFFDFKERGQANLPQRARHGASRLDNFARHCSELAARAHSAPGNALVVAAGKVPQMVDSACADGVPVPIPLHEEQPWDFNTLQFRRTLAWYVAHRPFGTVAGALQYKHAEITIFEGYSGRSESGFPTEVQAERELAGLGVLEALYEDYSQGIEPAGPHGPQLRRLFAEVQKDAARFDGRLLTEDDRVRELLRQRAKTLHIGLLNDCHFDVAHAQCLVGEDRRTGPAAPRLSVCRPGSCSNSSIRREHVPMWRRSLADVRHRRAQAGSRISSAQAAIFDAEEERIAAIIAPLEVRHA